jgi:hypothetical protein
MTLIRFADVITLPSTRAALSLSKWTADPLAAGIEHFATTGADKSASPSIQVLRTDRLPARRASTT